MEKIFQNFIDKENFMDETSYQEYLVLLNKRKEFLPNAEKVELLINKFFKKETYSSSDFNKEFLKLEELYLNSSQDKKYKSSHSFFYYLFEYILYLRLISLKSKQVKETKFSPLLYQMH